MSLKPSEKCEGCNGLAVKYCLQCETFQCDSCIQVIHSFSKQKNHSTVDVPTWHSQQLVDAKQNIPNDTMESTITCEVCNMKPAAQECLECQILLCQDHSSSHKEQKSDHNVIEIPEHSTFHKHCDHHKERFKMMCLTCNKPICILCLTSDHFAHKTTSLSSLGNKVYEEISNKYQILNEKNQRNMNHLKNLEEELNDIEKKKFVVLKSIKTELEKLYMEIENKEKELMSQMEDDYTKTLKTEYKKVTSWSNQAIHEISKSESLLVIKAQNSFYFVAGGLENVKNMDHLLNMDIVFTKINPLFQKLLDVSSQIESIKHLGLSVPIDPKNCTINTQEITGTIEDGATFTLHVVNSNGNDVSDEILQLYKFGTEIISAPKDENDAPHPCVIEQVVQNGQSRIVFHFKCQHSGEYNIRVHLMNMEVKGSPLIVRIQGKALSIVKRGDVVFDREWSWSHGTEWDALSFKVSQSIAFYGIGVFTGVGKHVAKLELLQGNENVKFFTKEFPFVTEKQEIQSLEFKNPINLTPNLLYTVRLLINGPNTFLHIENGLSSVFEDDITWTFAKSNLDENGSDVSMGQIPEFYYKKK